MRIIRALIVMGEILLSTMTALGQVHVVSATVRDCSSGYSCQTYETRATCAAIGRSENQYCFLTAGHVLRDVVKVRISIRGRWHDAIVGDWVCDDQQDIGFLHVPYDGALEMCQVGDDVPEVGADVELLGLTDGAIRKHRTRIETSRFAGDNILLTHHAIHGQSGGPVCFNGLVIGVVSGIPRSGGTLCSDCRAIRRFAAQHGYRIPRRRVKVKSVDVQDAHPPLPVPGASVHDGRSPAPAGCECDAIAAENAALKKQLAALENQRREVQFKTFTGQKGRANILVRRDGGTFVESLKSDGSIADSAEYDAGEPIRFDVVQVPKTK